MKISQNLLHNNTPRCRELEIISTITIKNNRLVEDYFLDYKTQAKLNWFINDRKGEPIFFNENDCEWLTPTFIRSKNELYGLSLIEKSNSTKLFLTQVKTQIDFDSFEAIGRFYAKDKNHFYFGPGGKKIKEDYLELFFDETYKNEWGKSNPDRNILLETNLWNSKIAISKEKVYWEGRITKGIDPSLKRISQFFWADKYSVFEYNLQRLKKIDKFDRQTLIYKTFIRNGSLVSLVTDLKKPAHCYCNDCIPDNKYDFKRFTPLFEELRGVISNEYWWYQMENRLQHGI
ncbi:DKNYY domain-containing protein [uncultured Aquimarina sp.]|uniref:DKNYY domain-containing protein n=1 Tax=uncultured Aquimarina sp. TaxID=575652 RepID=UPI0026397553|nr:DKNYY domain-containing protein [uncultured Aquimarina sp.]